MGVRQDILDSWPRENGYSHLVFKATPGVGDFMYPLNIALFRSFVLQKPVTLDIHWYHDKDYLFHFEDPETIIERFNYIFSFYEKQYTNLTVNHIFESKRYDLWGKRHYGFNRHIKKCPVPFRYNDWTFRQDILEAETYSDKIVVFRPTFNAQMPRSFKSPLTAFQWEDVIHIIREVHGYRVIEIDYRTPVREVLYHIKTCRATVSYEGMWHYVAKNCRKPMIVLSDDPITKTHTPDALIYNPRLVKGFDPAKGHKPNYKISFFNDFERRLKKAEYLSKKRLQYFERLRSGIKNRNR